MDFVARGASSISERFGCQAASAASLFRFVLHRCRFSGARNLLPFPFPCQPTSSTLFFLFRDFVTEVTLPLSRGGGFYHHRFRSQPRFVDRVSRCHSSVRGSPSPVRLRRSVRGRAFYNFAPKGVNRPPSLLSSPRLHFVACATPASSGEAVSTTAAFGVNTDARIFYFPWGPPGRSWTPRARFPRVQRGPREGERPGVKRSAPTGALRSRARGRRLRPS